ncbi:hypothetical protein [Riemerella columbina]|uniref:hypothetical protein n=1 Tax=Riemerella columbina TaxID=103810 RepID=UPI0003646000|nr:hypothetical protein [Riemerella columbina]
MNTLSQIENKILDDCQSLFKDLDTVQSIDDLISKKQILLSLYEKISFVESLRSQQDILFPKYEDTTAREPIAEEHNEPIENKSIDEPLEEETKPLPETEIVLTETKEEIEFEFITDDTPIKEEPFVENTNPINEVEEPQPSTISPKEDSPQTPTETPQQAEARKIKLAQIKNIKTQSLFDEELLAETEQTNPEPPKNTPKPTPTTDFKLDLNDRLAFTKMLFGGSQVELNDTINRLNTFDDLDAAREYLSDVYYERNWDKVDEYAQRLWTLVESKFI